MRGAYTAISRLSDAERARGVVTHSSGNHGHAVAYAAKLLGTHAVIVMPTNAPQVKIEGIKRHGGEIVQVPREDRESTALRLERERNLVPVPPYDHADVILGQSTCALEILDDLPQVTTIMTPIGGGGLLAGTSATVAALKPSVQVYGVEPAASAKLTAALAEGHPVHFAFADTIADGLIPPSIGSLTFEYIRRVVKEAIRVTDEEIAVAVKFLFQKMGLRVEPSGAVTVAALLHGHLKPTGTTVGVLSGGNVDPELFARLTA